MTRGIVLGACNSAVIADSAALVACATCGDEEAISIVMSSVSKYISGVVAGGYSILLEKMLRTGVDVNEQFVNKRKFYNKKCFSYLYNYTVHTHNQHQPLRL